MVPAFFAASLAVAPPPEPPNASGLHALCMELSASWQVGGAAAIGVGDWSEDPAAALRDTTAWTCRYRVAAAPGADHRFFGVATVRLRDAAHQVDATHLALGVTGLGWVHLGLLHDRSEGGKGRVTRLELTDQMLGPEPEVVVVSEVDDGETFVRSAHLCVDAGPRAAALCFSVPLAYGEGRGRRRTLDRVDLRLERDGRVALDQPPGTELDVTQPYVGVHDAEELLALSREHGHCDEGPCLRVLAFDVPDEPSDAPPQGAPPAPD